MSGGGFGLFAELGVDGSRDTGREVQAVLAGGSGPNSTLPPAAGASEAAFGIAAETGEASAGTFIAGREWREPLREAGNTAEGGQQPWAAAEVQGSLSGRGYIQEKEVFGLHAQPATLPAATSDGMQGGGRMEGLQQPQGFGLEAELGGGRQSGQAAVAGTVPAFGLEAEIQPAGLADTAALPADEHHPLIPAAGVGAERRQAATEKLLQQLQGRESGIESSISAGRSGWDQGLEARPPSGHLSRTPQQPEVHIVGELVGALGFGSAMVGCTYRIDTEALPWQPFPGSLTSGATQFACPERADSGGMAVWDHPLRMSFLCSQALGSGWPCLTLTLLKWDSWLEVGDVAGYAVVPLPTAAGAHELEAPVWLAHDLASVALHSHVDAVLGHTPRLLDAAVVQAGVTQGSDSGLEACRGCPPVGPLAGSGAQLVSCGSGRVRLRLHLLLRSTLQPAAAGPPALPQPGRHRMEEAHRLADKVFESRGAVLDGTAVIQRNRRSIFESAARALQSRPGPGPLRQASSIPAGLISPATSMEPESLQGYSGGSGRGGDGRRRQRRSRTTQERIPSPAEAASSGSNEVARLLADAPPQPPQQRRMRSNRQHKAALVQDTPPASPLAGDAGQGLLPVPPSNY